MKESARNWLILNLKRMRGRRSMAKIAEALDLSLRQYSRYENGESWPTPEMLETIARVLGTTASELVKNPNEKEPVALNFANPSAHDVLVIAEKWLSSTLSKRTIIAAILFEDETLYQSEIADLKQKIPLSKVK